MHTIYYSICYFANDFLKGNKSKIKLFTTGHSLGGGLATIFSYLWIGVRRKNAEKLASKLSKKIICVTFGSPKVIDKTLAKARYLDLLNKNIIIYKRCVSIGDLFVNQPFFHYRHPGAVDKNGERNKIGRQKYDMYCLNTLSYDKKKYYINYDKNLLCKCTNDRQNRINKIGLEPHGNYLYISFYDLFESKVKDLRDIKKSEYEDTVVQFMVCYSSGKKMIQKIGYIYLNDIRNGKPRTYYKPTRTISYFKTVNKEDICMKKKIFDFILNNTMDLKQFKKEMEKNISEKKMEKTYPYISRGRPMIDFSPVFYPKKMKNMEPNNSYWKKNKNINFMCLTSKILKL